MIIGSQNLAMESSPAFFSLVVACLLLNHVVAYVGYVYYHAFFGKLAEIPGPTLAKFTSVWKVRVAASGNAPAKFQNLHKKYGSVVRVRPTHVSVSDPDQSGPKFPVVVLMLSRPYGRRHRIS